MSDNTMWAAIAVAVVLAVVGAVWIGSTINANDNDAIIKCVERGQDARACRTAIRGGNQ